MIRLSGGSKPPPYNEMITVFLAKNITKTGAVLLCN